MNNVNLVGNIGQDPEMKYFESGKNNVKFSLALNSYNAKTKKEITDWVSCEAWGKTAELIGEYCKKGHKLAVEGCLKTSKWQDEQGNKHSRTFVLINRVEFLTPKDKSESRQQAQDEAEPEQQQFINPDEYWNYEEEISF